jgi:hypothetical protein
MSKTRQPPPNTTNTLFLPLSAATNAVVLPLTTHSHPHYVSLSLPLSLTGPLCLRT